MNITQLRIGNVTVDSIIERDGPWRLPADLFPAYDPETARPHFAEMDDFGFDPQSGRIVITYQTFVLRTPHHTILVDTCTGEDKNYPAPMNFPKQPWLDGFARLGLGFEDIWREASRLTCLAALNQAVVARLNPNSTGRITKQYSVLIARFFCSSFHYFFPVPIFLASSA